MQEQIRNFITEFTNKQNKSEQDIDELKNNIVKFGCEIFNIDESEFNNKSYNSICYEYSNGCEDRTKVANYLALCNLYTYYTYEKKINENLMCS
mgnify:CR=1 FL=1